MQHDEVIWQVVNQQFCSYKMKCGKNTFCKNPYNLTALCNRRTCPLANSRYATVLERSGKLFLFMKTIERAHSPKNLWERVPLSKNYAQALAQISENLKYWPSHIIHRCKQRLTKIHQYLIRMRKLRLSVRPEVKGIFKKVERREKVREEKAHKAARLEEAIKNELLDRLRQGVYGDMYAPQRLLDSALDEVGVPDKESETVDAPLSDEEEDEEGDEEGDEEEDEEGEGEDELEWEEEEDDDEEEEDEGPQFVEAYDEEIMGEDDIEELDEQVEAAQSSAAASSASRKSKAPGGKRTPRAAKRRHLEVEYEHEEDEKHSSRR